MIVTLSLPLTSIYHKTLTLLTPQIKQCIFEHHALIHYHAVVVVFGIAMCSNMNHAISIQFVLLVILPCIFKNRKIGSTPVPDDRFGVVLLWNRSEVRV